MHSKTCQIDTKVQLSEKNDIYCTLLVWQGGWKSSVSPENKQFCLAFLVQLDVFCYHVNIYLKYKSYMKNHFPCNLKNTDGYTVYEL